MCIVGDMKQSIYRFRQAEVSVMRRAVELFVNSMLTKPTSLDSTTFANPDADATPGLWAGR